MILGIEFLQQPIAAILEDVVGVMDFSILFLP
jgi:hypothetical protein